LEYVKSFHGSVEKSSLEKAQTITSKGLYEIACKENEIPTVENSIRLAVLESGKCNPYIAIENVSCVSEMYIQSFEIG